MSVTLEDIKLLSRAVVVQHGRDLHVVSVTSGGEGSERVEVTVDIGGCHTGPCRFVVNVSRADRPDFEREFSAKLREALQKHQAP